MGNIFVSVKISNETMFFVMAIAYLKFRHFVLIGNKNGEIPIQYFY